MNEFRYTIRSKHLTQSHHLWNINRFTKRFDSCCYLCPLPLYLCLSVVWFDVVVEGGRYVYHATAWQIDNAKIVMKRVSMLFPLNFQINSNLCLYTGNWNTIRTHEICLICEVWSMKYAVCVICRVPSQKLFFDSCLSAAKLFLSRNFDIMHGACVSSVNMNTSGNTLCEKLVYYSVVVKYLIAHRKYLLNGDCLPDTRYQINEYTNYFPTTRTLRERT